MHENQFHNETEFASKVQHRVLIIRSQFNNNRATYGAGALIHSVDTFIDQCIFISNEARIVAGGIFFSSIRNKESLTIKNSRFYGNRANLGGAIYGDGVNIPYLSELGVEIE